MDKMVKLDSFATRAYTGQTLFQIRRIMYSTQPFFASEIQGRSMQSILQHLEVEGLPLFGFFLSCLLNQYKRNP